MKSISSIEALQAFYPQPKERALKKQLLQLDKHGKHFISSSPFAVISTSDKKGNMDCSPRGGQKGFIHILNEKQILIPDATGNNRLDSLKNILETGRIGMLFLIPGIDETLRLNGSAFLSSDLDLLNKFENESKPPKIVVVVSIEEVFLHCAKALMRSALWNPDLMTKPQDFPTMGKMLNDQLGQSGVPESREEMVKRYKKDL